LIPLLQAWALGQAPGSSRPGSARRLGMRIRWASQRGARSSWWRGPRQVARPRSAGGAAPRRLQAGRAARLSAREQAAQERGGGSVGAEVVPGKCNSCGVREKEQELGGTGGMGARE
jgi:hypothetical protein